jgi:hypothetical protein
MSSLPRIPRRGLDWEELDSNVDIALLHVEPRAIKRVDEDFSADA